MEKKITLAANISIIVVALLAIFIFVRQRQVNPEMAQAKKLVGKSFPLHENWPQNSKSIVLALQVGCHFCAESAPFYRQLISAAETQNIAVYAVLPQPKESSADYLKKLDVPLKNLRQATLSDISVGGTPTLFLINSEGVVDQVWQGRLDQKQQQDVLKSLLHS